MKDQNTDVSAELFETHIADQISEKLVGFSEMQTYEQRFLNGLVRQEKPRKILEVGIAAGGSSAQILNAIQDDPEARLYSVDYSEDYYRDRSKKSGFLVGERFPDFLPKWTLRTGGLVAEYLEEFGGGFDFCFIDTMHCLPGEILDYLMVLPYLKQNAVVVLHDTSLPTLPQFLHEKWSDTAYATTLLHGIVNEPKWFPVSHAIHVFPNIGAFRLQNGLNSPYINDLFRALVIPWIHFPPQKEYKMLVEHFSKHYSKEQVQLFQNIYAYQGERIMAKASTNTHFMQQYKQYRKSEHKYKMYKILQVLTLGLVPGIMKEKKKHKAKMREIME